VGQVADLPHGLGLIYIFLGDILRKGKHVVRLFAKNREHEVQSLMLNMVNNNCPELRAMSDGPRLESRVNLSIVVVVIPIEKERLVLADRFTAVTKEFTTLGVALALHECRAVDEAILGFRCEGVMKFVRAQARHLSPMGGGFWQLGFRLKEVAHTDEYPELESVLL
jgi:hypothetical protein